MPPKRRPQNDTSAPTRKRNCANWQKVLNDYCVSTDKPSLKEFVENNLDLIKENTPNKSRGRTLWTNRFLKAVENAGISVYLLDEPDWTAYGFNNRTTHKKSTSTSYQACFDADEVAKFEKMFHSLNDECKWKLSTGRYVENILYDFAVQCQYITPAHNLILDLEDDQITALFNKEELEDIKQKKPFDFEESLPTEISSCFDLLKDKRSFDELFEAIDSIVASPRTKPETYWVKKTLISSLELFLPSNILSLSTKLSERDLVRLVWCCLLNCCIGADILVNTEKQHVSSSSANRSISSITKSTKQASSEFPDICYNYAGYDLGFCEAERFNKGSKATKRMNESRIKLPLMMKKALIRLINKFSKKRSASIVGFYASELELEALTMCCPSGFVCLVTRSRVCTFPATLALFKKEMKKLITVVANMKKEMTRNVDLMIEDDDEDEDEGVELPLYTCPF